MFPDNVRYSFDSRYRHFRWQSIQSKRSPTDPRKSYESFSAKICCNENSTTPKWKRLNWQYWYHPSVYKPSWSIFQPTVSKELVENSYWNLEPSTTFTTAIRWVAQVLIPLGNPEAHPSRLASTAMKASLGKESLRPRRNVGKLWTAPCSSHLELLLIVDCYTQKIGYTNSCCDSFRMDHLTLQSLNKSQKKHQPVKYQAVKSQKNTTNQNQQSRSSSCLAVG